MVCRLVAALGETGMTYLPKHLLQEGTTSSYRYPAHEHVRLSGLSDPIHSVLRGPGLLVLLIGRVEVVAGAWRSGDMGYCDSIMAGTNS